MDKFIIKGGNKLNGSLKISGAKNASLALLPASILAPGISVLKNTPELNDVYTMLKLLKQMGAQAKFENHTVEINTSSINSQTAPYEHVKKMRASVYVLGPLLTRYGKAKVSMPGGCAWGPRPINLHLEGLKKMGAEIEIVQGYINAKSKRLQGATIYLDKSSVGATGNLMMAAVLAKGTTTISNAAMEPEIVNLAECLVKMGAKIDGIGTSTITIEGVDELSPVEINTIPDRIEAGTMLIAGAVTRGKLKVDDVKPDLLEAVLIKLEESGCKINYPGENSIEVDALNLDKIKPVDVATSIFPGFPTDMQAQWTSYMALADGVSTVTDNIYIDRFKHVPELERLGAIVSVNENSAVIRGVKKFNGATVMSTDLRASVSLVLAGLAAEGTTEVLRIYHLDRGYQALEEKLRSVGADIQRVQTPDY